VASSTILGATDAFIADLAMPEIGRLPVLRQLRKNESRVTARTALLVLLLAVHVHAAGDPPAGTLAQREPEAMSRMHWSLAAGPVVEVATPGDRVRERGLLVAPAVDVRITPWFAYFAEAQLSTYVSPQAGAIAGVIPIGLRLHGRGMIQPFLAVGAGVSWTSFTDLRGLDRRVNYLTQIGAGVRRLRADASALGVELRVNHFSNWSSAPPNLGMENVAVLVGYRWPR
jgi:hypothetical protein